MCSSISTLGYHVVVERRRRVDLDITVPRGSGRIDLGRVILTAGIQETLPRLRQHRPRSAYFEKSCPFVC